MNYGAAQKLYKDMKTEVIHQHCVSLLFISHYYRNQTLTWIILILQIGSYFLLFLVSVKVYEPQIPAFVRM